MEGCDGDLEFFMNKWSIGTLSYLPIEAILNCLWVFVSPKTDSWSLGIIFCYVASGCDFIKQHDHFDCFGLGECRRMMEELLRCSPQTFIDSLGSINSPMDPAFAEAALHLFLVFFPFKADLPENDIIFVKDGLHNHKQAMLEGILRRNEFQRAHEHLALFRFEGHVRWNTRSPFYQMMGFNSSERSMEELCCKVQSGLMDFNPAERHSLAQIITLLG
jgi:serine/threonine protein kinase